MMLLLPRGWFVVAAGREIAPGKLTTVKAFGRELVVYRGQDDGLRVVDPHCPHLGAHLGGGRVKDCRLRCPMHGFEFDATGLCVSTPYGPEPRELRLQTWHVTERVGFVFVWFGGGQPFYELPQIDIGAFPSLSVLEIEFNGHPQETSENGVDLGHFAEVHGYREPEVVVAPNGDGAAMRSAFAVHRGRMRLEFAVTMHGLGFSLTEAGFPSIGVQTRIFSLVTPLGDGRVRARFCSTARAPVFSSLIRHFVHRSYLTDIRQDIAIWERKRHLAPPRLAPADVHIATYRKWAKQFYDPIDEASLLAARMRG